MASYPRREVMAIFRDALLMRPEWDNLKYRASMHFSHSVSPRGLRNFN